MIILHDFGSIRFVAAVLASGMGDVAVKKEPKKFVILSLLFQILVKLRNVMIFKR